jgi:hypothetical protein
MSTSFNLFSMLIHDRASAIATHKSDSPSNQERYGLLRQTEQNVIVNSIEELIHRRLDELRQDPPSGQHVLQSAERLDVSQWIPDLFQSYIANTHSEGRRLIQSYGVPESTIEPLQVAELVEAHRWAWKPERPRLVLIAESHVFTTLVETMATYQNPEGAHNAPSNFVRLVYCLGYGESLLCPQFKGGTPQYWRIFGNLVGTSPKHAN